jgi:hypothetical protein
VYALSNDGPAACDPAVPPQQHVNAKELLMVDDLRMGTRLTDARLHV